MLKCFEESYTNIKGCNNYVEQLINFSEINVFLYTLNRFLTSETLLLRDFNEN